MILDSGIHTGMSSDGMQISTMNPWINMYYVVTGKNARGELINAGQPLTRDEALRLYTAENGWFLHGGARLGTIEKGKYADLVVLSEDYFDPRAVPDEKIKDVHSVLHDRPRPRRLGRSGRPQGQALGSRLAPRARVRW